MIVARSPLRITLGGGGTDLPVYYKEHGGQFITATINKYVYISLHDAFINKFILKYSRYEKVDDISEVKHRIIREVFNLMKPEKYLEIASMADIPAGTGMGSSSAFTCALLQALHSHEKLSISKYELARLASKIEIELLEEPIGKQDQFSSAFGGFNEYIIDRDGNVTVNPLKLSKTTIANLQSGLLMFYTEGKRSASKILKEQQSQEDIVENLHQIKAFGQESKAALLDGDLQKFGYLLDKHWKIKRASSPSMADTKINYIYEMAREGGALGGKLIGAGGGGFFMFYTTNPGKLRRFMDGMCEELIYTFEYNGTQTILL